VGNDVEFPVVIRAPVEAVVAEPVVEAVHTPVPALGPSTSKVSGVPVLFTVADSPGTAPVRPRLTTSLKKVAPPVVEFAGVLRMTE